MPLISVVVPVYKTERFINQCIDSIINQTFKDYEVILVNDGSPDNCPKICDEYAAKYSHIKVVHKSNGGIVSARKAGALASSGQYILAVDSDDFVTENYLMGFAEAIERNKADIICGGFCSYNEKATVKFAQAVECGLYDKKGLEEKIYDRMLFEEPYYTFGIFPSVWTKCIRRELVIKNQIYIPDNITMGDDVALVYACILDSSSLEVISNNGYMYRYNNNSITHSYDERMASRCVSLIEHMYKVLEIKKWKAENQLYAYTILIQRLVIRNEMNNFKIGHRNLKLWSKNLYVKKIWETKSKPKVPFVDRMEIFALSNGQIWILTLMNKVRICKYKLRSNSLNSQKNHRKEK